MPEIKRIRVLRKGRIKRPVEILMDDGSTFIINREIATKAALHVGDDITQKQLDSLIKEDRYKTCYDLALYYLSYRPRSEAELRNHLVIKRKFNKDIVKDVIQKLKELKLINDVAFAELWRDDRIRYKPKSRLMIKRELMQKGVDAETVERITSGLDDEDSAYNAGLKKARLLKSLEWKEFYKRLAGYLGRRGYSSEVTNSVVRRLWQYVNPSLPGDKFLNF